LTTPGAHPTPLQDRDDGPRTKLLARQRANLNVADDNADLICAAIGSDHVARRRRPSAPTPAHRAYNRDRSSQAMPFDEERAPISKETVDRR